MISLLYVYLTFYLQTPDTGAGEPVEKSQTMDDVLEILIRTGGNYSLYVMSVRSLINMNIVLGLNSL